MILDSNEELQDTFKRMTLFKKVKMPYLRRHWRGFNFAIVFSALAILVLAGCGNVGNQSEIPEQSNPKATVAAFELYVSALVVAAEHSKDIDPDVDCLGEVGLDATIVKRSKGPEVVDALVGGSADFGTLAITPVVLQALQDSTLTIFGTIMTTDHDIKVVGRKSAGVTSPSDLRGKRIGYVGGTIGEIFLERYLEKHGISKDEVTLTSGGPPQLRDLFFNGSVDVIIIWEPIVQDILRDEAIDPEDIFLDVDRELYNLQMNLVARPEVLREKPDAAKRLLGAMLCGERVLKEHPEVARERLEQWLERESGTLDQVFDPPTFRVELNVPELVSALEAEAEWARRSVFSEDVTIPSDFSPYVDPSLLQEMAADRVIELTE